MSYDTALMEAYGKDIMAASFGIDVTNVAYWQNKFHSNDFSNPFTNRYLMDQVKQAAEEYHKARESGQFANSQAKKTATITSLFGEELEADQVKSIFGNLGDYAKEQELTDEDLLKQINSGVIPATSRLLQIDEDTWAYLHTDGKLHQLKKGENIKFDSKGNPTEISLNGSDTVDFFDHFASSFAGVFRGLGKLGALITAAFDSAINGTSYGETLANHVMEIDAALNDWDINVLGRLDHIDLDGFNFSAKDIFMGIGDITGMVLGSMALGGMAGKLNQFGSSMMAKEGILNKAAGWGIRSVGRVGLRSTGWYAGVSDSAKFSLFNKTINGTAAHWLNTAFKVTPVLAAKDFYNTVHQLNSINIQAKLNGQEEDVFSESDIMNKALQTTAFSWITNTLLSSNIDSSFSERWMPGKWDAMHRISDTKLLNAQGMLKQNVTNAQLKDILFAESNLIKLDNIVDFMNTLAGNQFQAAQTSTKTVNGKMTATTFKEFITGYTNTDKDGKETKVSALWSRPEFWKDVTTTAVMQFKEYSKDRKQKMFNSYNTAMNTLRGANEDWLSNIDEEISKTKDQTKKETLQLVKQDYIRVLNDVSDKTKDNSYEARILRAMDHVTNQLGKLPKGMEDAITNNINKDKLQVYQETYNFMNLKIQAHNEYKERFYREASSKPHFFQRWFDNGISKVMNNFRGIDEKTNAGYTTAEYDSKTRLQPVARSKYAEFLDSVGLTDAAKLRDSLNLPDEAFELMDAMGTTLYTEVTDKTKQKMIADTLKAKGIDIPPDGFMVYDFKQEAGYSDSKFNNRMKQSVNKATMDILESAGHYGVFKIDDNTYVMSMLNSGAGQALTFETQCNINSGIWAIKEGNATLGSKLILSSIMAGNDTVQNTTNNDVFETLHAVLDTSVKNKAIDKLDAADVLHVIVNTNTEDKTVQKIQKAISKHLDTMVQNNEFNNLSEIEKYYLTYEAIVTAKAYKGKNKLIPNSKESKMIQLLIGANGNPTADVKDILNKFIDTKRWSPEDSNNFTNAVTETIGRDKLPAVGAAIDDLLKDSSAPNKDYDLNGVENIFLKNKKSSKELKQVLVDLLKGDYETLQKYNKHLTEHTATGETITIDLTKLAGKKTKQAVQEINSMVRMKQEGVHIEIPDRFYGLADEFRGRMNLANENGSSLLVFDLNNQVDVDNFNVVAKKLGLFDGQTIELTGIDNAQKVINELDNGWEDAITYNVGTRKYVSLGEKLQKKLDALPKPDLSKLKYKQEVVDENGNISQYDVAKQIAAKIHVTKTSNRIKKLKSGIQKILPTTEKSGLDSVIGYDESTGKYAVKQGISASQGTGAELTQQVMDYADGYTKDSNVGTYFFLRNIIDKADPQTFQFSYYGVDDAFVKKLQNLQIVGDNGFYEIIPATRDNVVTIKLKDNQQANMINYLDSTKDFNLFKLLPLISDKAGLKSNYVWAAASDGTIRYKDVNGQEQTAYVPNMYNGNDVPESTGLQQIYNMSVGFDQDSTLKAQILGGLAKANDLVNEGEGTYTFDPFNGNKKVMSIKNADKILKAYYNDDLKTLESYADEDYEAAYLASVLKLDKDYSTDDTSEDWKVLYEDSEIAKRLIKAQENGEDISSSNKALVQELTSEYIDYYKAKIKSYKAPSNIEYSYGGIPYNSKHTVDDDAYVNAQILKGIAYDSYLVDVDNIKPQDLEIIVGQAIDNFKTISQDTTLRGMMNIPNTVTLFQENNAAKCIQGFSGNNNYLDIPDCEYWANLQDEEINQLSEAYANKLTVSDIKEIQTTSQQMLKIMSEMQEETDSNYISEYRKATDLVTPSVSINKDTLVTDVDAEDLGDIEKQLLTQNKDSNRKERTIKLADDFIDNINDRYDKLSKQDTLLAEMKTHQDEEIRKHNYYPHTAEVLQLENIFAREQAAEIVGKTISSVKNTFGTDDVVSQKITNDMYYSAMDTSAGNEWQQLKLYDKNGNDLFETGFTSHNYMEYYAKLSQLEQEGKLKDTFFVQLNKHALDTYDPITFKHTTMNDESIAKIKNYFLINSFDEYIKGKQNNWTSGNTEAFVNHLRGLQENNIEAFNDIVSNITRTQLSKQAYRNIVIKNIKDVFDNKYTSEQIFNVVVPSILGHPTYSNEGVTNYMERVTSSLTSDNPVEQIQSSLMTYGRHYQMMTDDEKQLLKNQSTHMLEDLNMFTSKQSNANRKSLIRDITQLSSMTFGSDAYNEKLRYIFDNYNDIDPKSFIKAYIATSVTPEGVTYRTSGVTLDQMINSDTLLDTKLKITNDDGESKTSLLNLRNKLNDGLQPGESMCFMDIEGMIPDKDGPNMKRSSTGTLRDIFQVHFKEYTSDGPQEHTYYIIHDEGIENYISTMGLRDSSYYKSEEGYKNAVEEYAKGINSSNISFISEEEFKNILRQKSNTTFFAYNGDTYDFKYIKDYIKGKNNSTIDATVFDSMTYAGDDIDRRIQKMVIGKDLGLEGSFEQAAHNAKADTDAMEEWIRYKVDSFVDPTLKAKTKMKTVVDGLMDEFNIDADSRNLLYKELDDSIIDGQTFINADKFFVQGMPDASTTSYLTRLINDAREENIGYNLYGFINNPELWQTTGFKGFETAVKNNQLNHITDLVVEQMLTSDIDANTALRNLYFNAEESEGDPLYLTTNKLLETELTVDKNSEDFITLKKKVMKAMDGLDSKYSIITKEDKDNYKKYYNGQKFSMYAESLVNESKEFGSQGFLTEAMRNAILEDATSALSSSEEGLEQFRRQFQFAINTRAADQFAEQAKKYTDVKGFISFFRQGSYKRIHSTSPTEGTSLYTQLTFNPTTNRLEKSNEPLSIEANTVLVDRKALYDMTGSNIKEIFDDNGEAYIVTHRQPSADKHQINYFKLKVIEGDKGDVYATPMVWRSVFAGDFDGDATTQYIITDPFEKALAKFRSNNTFLTHNIQEDLFADLVQTSPKSRNRSLIPAAMALSNDSEIIEISKKIDGALRKNNESQLTKYTEQLRNRIMDIKGHYDTYSLKTDDIMNIIGVQESNGHRYIRNYNVLNDPNSYSYEETFKVIADGASTKTNLKDSLFGFKKQRFMSNEVDISNLEQDPLQKLNLTSTRMTGELIDQIDSRQWTQAELSNYFDTMQNTIGKFLTSHELSSETKEYITNNLSPYIRSLSSDIANLDNVNDRRMNVIANTQFILNALDDSIKFDKNINNELASILTNKELPISTAYEENIKHHKQLLADLNNIKGFRNYVRGGESFYDSTDGALINDIMNKAYRSDSTIYDDTLLNKLKDNNINIAILEGVPVDGAVDTIYVNANSKKRAIVGAEKYDLAKKFENIQSEYVKDIISELATDNKKAITKLSPESINSYIDNLHTNIDKLQNEYDTLQSTIDLAKKSKSEGLEDLYVDSENKVKELKDLRQDLKTQENELRRLSNIFYDPNGNKKAMMITNSSGDTYIVHLDTLAGKKGYAIGKGMIQDIRVIDGEGDWDIAFSNELLSRIDKLGYHSTFKNKKQGLYNITIQPKTGNISNYDARIFTDVPFYLLENFNKTQTGKSQKVDMMSILSLQGSVEELGMLGSSVLKRNGNSIDYTNRDVIQPIQDANGSTNIYWANSAGNELRQRAIGLGNILEADKLWGKYNSWAEEKFHKSTGIDNVNEYQDILAKYYNPTSLDMYNSIQGTFQFLLDMGYTKEGILDRLTPQQRMAFSKEIEDCLTTYQQGNIINYKGIRILSKSKAKEGIKNRSAVFVGDIVNPGEMNARQNVGISSEEYFYIPYNTSFRVHSGYSLNVEDAFQATAEQLLQRKYHYNGEQGLGFRPLDKKYAVVHPTNLTDSPINNNPKEGQANTKPDQNVVLPTVGRAFMKKNKEVYADNDPKFEGAYYRNLARGEANKDLRVSKVNKLAALISSLNTHSDPVDGLLDATARNTSSELLYNAYRNNYSLGEEGPVLTVQPKTKIGTHEQLTSEGRDFLTSRMNFYTIKDVYNTNETPDIDLSKVKIPENNQEEYIKAYNVLQQAIEHNRKATKNFTTDYNLSNIKDTFDMPITSAADSVDAFDTSYIQSAGIKIRRGDKGDTMAVSMSLEKAYGDSQMIQAQGDEYVENIRKASRRYGDQAFMNYYLYPILQECESQGEDLTDYLKVINVDRNYYDTVMKRDYEKLNADEPLAAAMKASNEFTLAMGKKVTELYNDPIPNTTLLLSSFTSTKHKEIKYGAIKDALHAALDFNEFNPITRKGQLKENMIFNFFDSRKSINREMAKLIGNENLTTTLHQRGLVSNEETVNALNGFLDSGLNTNSLYIKQDDLKDPEFKQIQDTLYSLVQDRTDIDMFTVTKGSKSEAEKMRRVWMEIKNQTNQAMEALPEGINTDYTSLKAILGRGLDIGTEDSVKKAVDMIETKIIFAQRLMELDKSIATNVEAYFNDIYKQGYTLVNKYGQKLSKDSYVTPIGDSSTRWLVDNIEMAANNQSTTKWNQFLMEKAIRGELYLAKQDLADQLEDKYFTTKIPGKVMSTLKHISKTSASLQMAMPAKMLGRLFRFTGTDYLLGSTYSPKTWKNVPKAAKELSAAIYSKGATVEPGSLLDQYLHWEGQPLNVKGKDPITFSEDIDSSVSKITDKLTEPLAYQNHLGRYAIWLTAYESFENGDPNYGPAYYLKEQIDSLGDNNAAKATYIMDQMIGSPAGFPYLSKKTNGLMMYATFPMNLTRTGGAYLMSLGRLFQEGFTSENAPQWVRTVGAPSCTAIVAAYLGNLLISYVCDKYGVDEKTEKKWKEEQVTIDPIGTILGGTPSVVYDSMNPAFQLKEMYLNPLFSEYNKSFGDKALGLINQNVLSKLNPAIKAPAEVLIQKDFFGSKPTDTSKAYTMYENGIRKALGFVLGSGIANSMVDQEKISKYDSNSNFLSSLWKGFTKGFSGDLGNQKSWKKDISNYYSAIDSIKTYNYAQSTKNGGYDATYEDLMDGNYMKTQRNYQSKYGDIDKDDYDRVNKMLKKMIQGKENPTTIYTYITEEWNNGVNEATLRKALNNNSLIRKLNNIDKAAYYRTLSDKDISNLEKAIKWEEETYPLLKDFFPNTLDTYYKKYKKPYYKKQSVSGGSYPKTYYPKKAPQVNYYPNNGYSNKKLSVKNPKASINRVKVEVSPQMAVWTKDYNKTKDLRTWQNSDYNRTKPLSHGGGK